jgi:hypothetical protein
MLMRLFAQRRGFPMVHHAAAICAVTLASGVLDACREPVEISHGPAWDHYVKADDAYHACLERGRASGPCLGSYRERQKALEAYRAEAAGNPPTVR